MKTDLVSDTVFNIGMLNIAKRILILKLTLYNAAILFVYALTL